MISDLVHFINRLIMMTIHKIRCGMFSWPISIKKYFYRHGISVQKATIELPITSSVLYVCFVLYICCWNCQAHSQLSALLNVISQIRGETASELMLCFHCFHPPTIILFAEGTYRVVINEWPKVWLYCDLTLSPGDFLSLLGAHQMWSIW